MSGAALLELGWDGTLAAALEALRRPALVPGRVVRQTRKSWVVTTAGGDHTAHVPGRLRRELAAVDLPAVGDWVALAPSAHGPSAVEAVLPRRSALVRHGAGGITAPQVLAANVDTLFLVSGLDRDFNPRRIERFLALAHESGAAPVVVLNKIDIAPDVAARVTETERVALDVPVLAVSARLGTGVELLHRYLGPGSTGAFVGSSGVGKSSLINAVAGEERMATGEVREHDQRGRHVTTHRELLVLPGGRGCVIDTPGIRELQLWAGDEGLAAAFADVEAVAAACRFNDCSHEAEPGCAVREAVGRGALAADRYASYRRLRSERDLRERRTREYQARTGGRRPYERGQRSREKLGPEEA